MRLPTTVYVQPIACDITSKMVDLSFLKYALENHTSIQNHVSHIEKLGLSRRPIDGYTARCFYSGRNGSPEEVTLGGGDTGRR